MLRHNCSRGALGVQSKLTTIASNPCNHGNLGLHFLLFWFAMGNEAFILSSLWFSKTACLEGFREVLRYIKICSASRRALRIPILAGPVGSSGVSWLSIHWSSNSSGPGIKLLLEAPLLCLSSAAAPSQSTLSLACLVDAGRDHK